MIFLSFKDRKGSKIFKVFVLKIRKKIINFIKYFILNIGFFIIKDEILNMVNKVKFVIIYECVGLVVERFYFLSDCKFYCGLERGLFFYYCVWFIIGV